MSAMHITINNEPPFVNGCMFTYPLGKDCYVSHDGQHLLNHPHVLLAVDEEYGWAYIVSTSTDQDTLVNLRGKWRRNDVVVDLFSDGVGVGNGLKEDSFVNCDSIRRIDLEKIKEDYERGVLRIIGIASEVDYGKLRVASLESKSPHEIYDLMCSYNEAF